MTLHTLYFRKTIVEVATKGNSIISIYNSENTKEVFTDYDGELLRSLDYKDYYLIINNKLYKLRLPDANPYVFLQNIVANRELLKHCTDINVALSLVIL